MTETVPNNNLKILIKLITIITTVLLGFFIVYGIKEGIFSSNQNLIHYMKQFGIWAPLFFIFLQIIQVIFPVIPGGASCFAGVLAFGPINGFIYNYIGLCLGSFFAFYLSRRYGMTLIQKLFKQSTIEKYMKYIKHQKFKSVFVLGIFLPGAPDDLLCYIAGISKMTWKEFVWIIAVGKPFTLVLYSLFMQFFPLFLK